jgi:hypothetical protein
VGDEIHDIDAIGGAPARLVTRVITLLNSFLFVTEHDRPCAHAYPFVGGQQHSRQLSAVEPDPVTIAAAIDGDLSKS